MPPAPGVTRPPTPVPPAPVRGPEALFITRLLLGALRVSRSCPSARARSQHPALVAPWSPPCISVWGTDGDSAGRVTLPMSPHSCHPAYGTPLTWVSPPMGPHLSPWVPHPESPPLAPAPRQEQPRPHFLQTLLYNPPPNCALTPPEPVTTPPNPPFVTIPLGSSLIYCFVSPLDGGGGTHGPGGGPSHAPHPWDPPMNVGVPLAVTPWQRRWD